MVESHQHAFLKQLGAIFLYKQGCFLVAEEVSLNRCLQRRIHDLDGHEVVDVCGVGSKYLPIGCLQEEFEDLDLNASDIKKCEAGFNILRGVEVKVSRSDFRNGFICSSCNYNYLLTPMRLIAPYELPKGVGLIEYNKHKFALELSEGGELKIQGLRVVKRPVFRRVPQPVIDGAIAEILRPSVNDKLKDLYYDLTRNVIQSIPF